MEKIGRYFHKKTAELVSVASYSLINTNTKSVNIVGDVVKLVPVYWAASEIVRILRLNTIRRRVFLMLFPQAGIALKDKSHPSGVYTPQELYNILGEIYQ